MSIGTAQAEELPAPSEPAIRYALNDMIPTARRKRDRDDGVNDHVPVPFAVRPLLDPVPEPGRARDAGCVLALAWVAWRRSGS